MFSAGVAGGAGGFLVGGPVGAGVGAGAAGLGYKTFVDSLNASGPGPGRQWLISDARIYNSINVAGNNILPTLTTAALNNVTATTSISPSATISFVSPNAFPVSVTDSNGHGVNTINSAGLFVAQSTSGIALGSYVLNTIGLPGSRPLTGTDSLDIELGSLLSVPDGTPINFRSTLDVGVTPVPEPSSIMLLGFGVGTLLGIRTLKLLC